MTQVKDRSHNAANTNVTQRYQPNQAVNKLAESINYWEDWEAGYSDLREALRSLGDHAFGTAIQETASESVGHLLSGKDIADLLTDERKGPRTAQQVTGLLSRRIDYVQSNITSLKNQLQAAEVTLERASNTTRQDDAGDFPLMEIQEELDEDDNVISGSVTPASAAAPQVVEALKKAGLKGLPDSQQEELVQHKITSKANDNPSGSNLTTSPPILKQGPAQPPQPRRDQQPSPSTSESDSKGDDCKTGRRRKSVTFADGTKSDPPASTEPRSARDVQAAKVANTARRIKAEVRGSIDALKKVHGAGFISDEVFDRFRQEYVERLQITPSQTVKQSPLGDQAPSGQEVGSEGRTAIANEFRPIVPTNECPEDAALRREMIRYNMSEVGAVVAEMNLDDDDQSYPSDSVDSNNEDEHGHSSDEDEDRWGLSTKRVLSNGYIKRMQDLERKLHTEPSQINKSSTDIQTLLQAEGMLETGPDGNLKKTDSKTASTNQGRKAVRFAKALDIQERPPSPKPVERKGAGGPPMTPVHTDIVERPPLVTGSHERNPLASKKKKASQFKKPPSAERQAAGAVQHPSVLQMQASNGNQIKTPSLPAFTPPATPKVIPTGPPGRTHSPNVIERPYSDGSNTANVSEPDGLDATLLQQELAMEHESRRNRMMQRQGGLLSNEADEENEEAEGPLVDENGKKISRFKAARLKALGG
ncbi:MAG: hypothetical protein Q9204_001520 [Flavoplaca sp. TL-2023a]